MTTQAFLSRAIARRAALACALVLCFAGTAAAQVTEAWVNRYNNFMGAQTDSARAIAVDPKGNVLVTGSSYDVLGGIDIATIKYDAKGNPVWAGVARRWSGPGFAVDSPTAMAVDAAGNIYVTGSHDSDLDPVRFDNEFVTIKYNADGEEQWARLVRGDGGGDDIARAIAVDSDGNVYVAGQTCRQVQGFVCINSDYATVKYDPDGNELWIQETEGPAQHNDSANAIAVDANGNVYVTGQVCTQVTGTMCTSFDYATLKYDAATGIIQWASTYNGPEDATDIARALAVDLAGDVYVTGASRGTGTADDATTIKYDPDGIEVWVRPYNGPGNGRDVGNAIALDGVGNVIVAGDSAGDGTLLDIFAIKYGPDGDEFWPQPARYNGPGNANDSAAAVAVDLDGYVYVTGWTGSTVISVVDYATLKFDVNTGEEHWAITYNGPGNNQDFATAIALDAGGNVYVTGFSWGGPTGFDYATIKYTQP